MNVDDLPDQLQSLFDRARAGLNQQVTTARKVVDNLTVEKTAVQNALAELKEEIKKAKADLDVVRAHQHRASTLAALDREIAKARTELERLKAENARAATALEALTKKRTEFEAQVNALNNEVTQLVARRASNQEMMARMKQQLQSLPVGG